MEKERIEVVLIPQAEKKENALLPYLFGKWKMLLAFLLVGLCIGAAGVYLYYRSAQKSAAEMAAKAQAEAEAPGKQMQMTLNEEFLTEKFQDAGYTVANFSVMARAQMAMFEEQAKQLLLAHNAARGVDGRQELTYEIGLVRQGLSGIERILSSFNVTEEGPPEILQHADKAFLKEKVAVNEAVIEMNKSSEWGLEGAADLEAQIRLQELIHETERYKKLLEDSYVEFHSENTEAVIAQMDVCAGIIDSAKVELIGLYEKYVETPGREAANATANTAVKFSMLKAAAIPCLCVAGACILWLIVALLQKEWRRLMYKSGEKQGAAV